MRIIRPLSPVASRSGAALVLLAWLVQMGILVHRAYLRDNPSFLAGELSHYSSSAQWKGVYYRGEKIGFTVNQTIPTEDGYEIQEDGRLQLSLLGMTTTSRVSSRVRVDEASQLRSFEFSLDPGTGPIAITGRLEGLQLYLDIRTSAGVRSEVRTLPRRPSLSLNFARELVAAGIEEGKRIELEIFDPATLRNATMSVEVKGREVVEAAGLPVPAFRLESRFLGMTVTSWITDTGELVREESPLGMIIVKESPEAATRMAVPGKVQADMATNLAVVPSNPTRIDDPVQVQRLGLRLDGADELLATEDVQGAGQTVSGREIWVDRKEAIPLDTLPADARQRYLAPETFIESDDPEIVAEARRAIADADDPQQRMERLVRHVHAILEKRPSMGIPSATEVLRTRLGDCNEHAVLLTAMARASGLPARIAVGLVHMLGAFYYHAWVEVFVENGPARGRWIPVDPALNQVPADATHIRLARGGLDRQAALVGAMGRMEMAILDVQLAPDATRVLVGTDRSRASMDPLDMVLPSRAGKTKRGCWFVQPRSR